MIHSSAITGLGHVSTQRPCQFRTVPSSGSWPIWQRYVTNKRQKHGGKSTAQTRALELDIELPDIDLDLSSVQSDQGAEVQVKIATPFQHGLYEAGMSLSTY